MYICILPHFDIRIPYRQLCSELPSGIPLLFCSGIPLFPNAATAATDVPGPSLIDEAAAAFLSAVIAVGFMCHNRFCMFLYICKKHNMRICMYVCADFTLLGFGAKRKARVRTSCKLL